MIRCNNIETIDVMDETDRNPFFLFGLVIKFVVFFNIPIFWRDLTS